MNAEDTDGHAVAVRTGGGDVRYQSASCAAADGRDQGGPAGL